MSRPMFVYINGKVVREAQASISIHDHGFLYGDGVYETLRVRDGVPLFLKEHLSRLEDSLKRISLKSPLSMKGVGQAVLKVVKTNRLAEAAVRITLTRGAGLPGLDPKNCKSPTLLITCRPFSGYPSNFTRKGMTAVVVGVRRNSPESLPPSVKSISCLNNVLAKIESQRSKADEAIMLSEDGLVAEGSVTNVFIVKEGAIYTPALDGRQLAGVTRNHVCQVARANGFRVVETKVSVHDLLSADEVFLTNSLMEVMPVAKVLVGKTVKLKPNWPITRQLMICYTPPRRKSNRTSGSI